MQVCRNSSSNRSGSFIWASSIASLPDRSRKTATEGDDGMKPENVVNVWRRDLESPEMRHAPVRGSASAKMRCLRPSEPSIRGPLSSRLPQFLDNTP